MVVLHSWSFAGVDAIVIGRKTFEKVRSFGGWAYGKERVVVLSNHPVELVAAAGGFVEHMAGPPAEIDSQLAAVGARHLCVDGGITIQGFLRAGLVGMASRGPKIALRAAASPHPACLPLPRP